MTAVDLLSVLGAVVALGAAAALTYTAVRANAATQRLLCAVDVFEAEVHDSAAQLRAAALAASSQVERMDDLLDVAAVVGRRVDSASDATYRAIAAPMIKSAALASGTRRAARRLRGSGDARAVVVGR